MSERLPPKVKGDSGVLSGDEHYADDMALKAQKNVFKNRLDTASESPEVVLIRRLDAAERRFDRAAWRLKQQELPGQGRPWNGPLLPLVERVIGGYAIKGFENDVTFTKGGKSLRISYGSHGSEASIHMDNVLIGLHDLNGATHRHLNLNLVLQTFEKFSKILEDNLEKPEETQRKLIDEVNDF